MGFTARSNVVKKGHICLHCGRYKVPKRLQKQIKSQGELIDYFYQLGGFEMRSGLMDRLTSDASVNLIIDAVHNEQIYPFIRTLTQKEFDKMNADRAARVKEAIQEAVKEPSLVPYGMDTAWHVRKHKLNEELAKKINKKW